MKLKVIAASFAALVVLTGVAACGGSDDKDDGDESTNTPSGNDGGSGSSVADIRTSKGLSLAAVNAGLVPGASNTRTDVDTAERSAATDSSAGVGAPAPAADSAFALNPDGSDTSSNPQQASAGGGLTVSGYGTATADADSAVIEFYIGNIGGEIAPDTRVPSGSGNAITEEQLQPVIDALVGAGVAREDIELVSQGYYDPYYSSATLRAKVRDINIVETAAQAALDASAALSSYQVQSTNITYTLSDCAAMERAALEAAAEDAADHADLLADVLNVGRGAIVAANDYSYPYYYYGYNGFDDNVCASSYYGAVPFYSGMPLTGDRAVEVFGNVSITYAIN